MKKVYVLIMLSMWLIPGSIFAADLNGTWAGTMYCCHDDPTNPTQEDFVVEITQDGDFFTSVNVSPNPGETCGGVLDGNKISMSCPGDATENDFGTFAYGEVKGNTIYVINHIPYEGRTCKGTAYRVK